jgi:subtilisin family serine protease
MAYRSRGNVMAVHRILFFIALAASMAAAADTVTTNACPPLTTLAASNGWELATATYTARQDGDSVTVTATGQNRTGGFKTQLAREPVKSFPPKLALYQKRPAGMATQAITPFTVCATFKATQKIDAVTVRDSKGEHHVPVEPAR